MYARMEKISSLSILYIYTYKSGCYDFEENSVEQNIKAYVCHGTILYGTYMCRVGR